MAGALRLPLPAEAEGEASFLQEIGKFLLGHGLPSRVKVVFGVSRSEFLMRRFETPPVKPKTLPELVEFEIERHLPGKREEFLCGWRVEGKRKGGGYTLLLGAGRKEHLARALTLMRRANIPPASIQAEPMALAAAFRRAVPQSRGALLLDLGLDAFGADTLREGRLEASRQFRLDDTIWRESFHAAAIAEGEGAVAARQAASRRLGEEVVARLKHPLFLESLPERKIPQIHIVGYGVNRSLLIEKLQNDLRVPVRVFSPWLQVRWAAPPAETAPYTLPLVLALQGLADRADLELAEERQGVIHRGPRRRLTVTLAILLATLLLAQLVSCQLRQRRQLARVEQEIKALKVKMAAVDAVNRRVQEQRTRLRYLRGMITERVRPPEILKELTTLIPDDTYLSEYAYKDRFCEITGFSPSASKLLPILEDSPLFMGVEFSAPIVAQSGGLERFRIRMRLERAGG